LPQTTAAAAGTSTISQIGFDVLRIAVARAYFRHRHGVDCRAFAGHGFDDLFCRPRPRQLRQIPFRLHRKFWSRCCPFSGRFCAVSLYIAFHFSPSSIPKSIWSNIRNSCKKLAWAHFMDQSLSELKTLIWFKKLSTKWRK
jgi:hypothetical protein